MPWANIAWSSVWQRDRPSEIASSAGPVARGQVSDSLELSMVWFYGALPVGGALMILFSLPQLWRLARGR